MLVLVSCFSYTSSDNFSEAFCLKLLMLVFVRPFPDTARTGFSEEFLLHPSRAFFSEEFLLHSSNWFYLWVSRTHLILSLVRSFPYTSHASFCEGVSFRPLMSLLVRSFSYLPLLV